MNQTTSISERLNAVRDELETASTAQDAEVRARVKTALNHAQQAKTQLQAEVAKNEGSAQADYDQTVAHLSVMADNGQRALDQAGSSLQAHVNSMIASAKSAIDSYNAEARRG
jgi:hypothetical protein